jgi:hypothetical protein
MHHSYPDDLLAQFCLTNVHEGGLKQHSFNFLCHVHVGSSYKTDKVMHIWNDMSVLCVPNILLVDCGLFHWLLVIIVSWRLQSQQAEERNPVLANWIIIKPRPSFSQKFYFLTFRLHCFASIWEFSISSAQYPSGHPSQYVMCMIVQVPNLQPVQFLLSKCTNSASPAFTSV